MYMHDRSLSLIGIDPSIKKSGGVRLVLSTQN